MHANHTLAKHFRPLPPELRPSSYRMTPTRSRPVLLYQPRHSLLDGAPTGAETRLRMPLRRHGSTGPAPLPPPGEPDQLAVETGLWVLRTACADAAVWHHRRVCVGVTAAQLHGDRLLEHLATALQDSGLAPERLVLALGEPALGEIDIETLLALSALRDLGVGIELEDFGAECGDLGLLKRLPLTALKLSRALLRQVPGDREDAAIVHAVITAATACGVSVVADGVETEAQRGFLASCGAEEGQGGLFGHAVPADALT